MAEPYIRKDPGDIIRAQDWNGMQAKARAALEGHAHTGGEQGPLLTGASIARDAALEVKSLAASAALSVRGRELAAELEKLDHLTRRVETHGHTGGEQGPPLTGASIARDAALEVKSLTASAALSVKGRDLAAELEKLDQLVRRVEACLSFAGETLAGLRLAGANNGLGYFGGQSPFGATPDGPVLYGAGGGALGSARDAKSVALTWDNQSNVAVRGKLSVARDLSVTGSSQFSDIKSASISAKGRLLVASDKIPDDINAEQNKATGSAIFIELLQIHGPGSERVRPGIRFHAGNGFMHRLEGAQDGLHVKDGSTKLDEYRDLYCRSVKQPSDAALKTDISPLRAASSVLAGVEPVRFRWKSDGPAGRMDIGIIAQQLEPVLPELVFEGADGVRSVNYSGLTAVLLAALQEQQAEIVAIKASLAAATAAGGPGALHATEVR